MNVVPIVFAFDDKMLMPAAVCIDSLLKNALPDTFYDIFIIHHQKYDFSSSCLKELSKQHSSFKITYKKIGDTFGDAYEVRGVTKTTYYRLIIPDIVTEYEKVLYSDVDVIFRDDLTKYYNIELGENYFAAVDSSMALNPDDKEYVRKNLGLNLSDGFYYAGNLVVNSALLRKDRMVKQFIQMAQKDYKFQDMDIINLSCNGRILPLSPAYCLTDYIYDKMIKEPALFKQEEIKEALEKGIVHYNGPKPWVEGCLNMDIWWHYYRNSIFFEEAFAHKIWSNQRYVLERLSLSKRIKLVARYFRKGGRM